MNLEELRDQWMAQNDKLEKSLRLNVALSRDFGARKARGALSRLSRAIWIELMTNLVAVVLLGSFIADHIGETRFLVPAIVLDLLAIGLIITTAWQLAALGRVDFAAPILVNQKRLEALRIQRLRETKWVLILAPLLWTPLSIVALKGCFGVDVYAVFSSAWLLMNLLVGAGLIPLVLWASGRFAGRFEHFPFVRRLLDDIAGRNLTAARACLDRLADFGDETD